MTSTNPKVRFLTDSGERFPEWVRAKLGEITTTGTGSSNRDDSFEEGAYAFFDRSVDRRKSNRYTHDGTAIIVSGEGKEFPPRFFEGKFDLHQRCYAIMNFGENDPRYLYQWISYRKDFFLTMAVGSTVKSLRMNAFEEFPIWLPCVEEQKKIADALSAVDDKTSLLRKHEAALIQFKAGLMQKLFSQELRFQQDDGEDFPDWEEHSLDDMALQGVISLGRGNVISKTDLQANPGDYPVFSSSSMGTGEMGRYGKWMFDEELITWSIDGGGRFFHRNVGKFSVTNVSGYMRVDTSKISYGFLHACLEQQRTTKTFDYQNKAHPSVIRELYSVSLPSLEEQRKIADALSAMDAKIAAVGKEIALMETFKKGLLQQMFV